MQLVLARLYGFPSWTKLRRHVELVKQYSRSLHRQPVVGPISSQQDLVDEFLSLACLTYDGSIDSQGRWQQARQLLAKHPALAAASIHTIAAVGRCRRQRTASRETCGLLTSMRVPSKMCSNVSQRPGSTAIAG